MVYQRPSSPGVCRQIGLAAEGLDGLINQGARFLGILVLGSSRGCWRCGNGSSSPLRGSSADLGTGKTRKNQYYEETIHLAYPVRSKYGDFSCLDGVCPGFERLCEI